MKKKGSIKMKIAGIAICTLLVATSVALIANRGAADWYPEDGHKMHFPQMPCLWGCDVDATYPKVLADDWMCNGTGYVEDIHFWGSWWNDMECIIDGFFISIWSNDPGNETIPSHPDELLWERYIMDFKAIPWEYYSQSWYDPETREWYPENHNWCYQYNIVNITDPFVQWNGTIYWLAISANVVEPGMYWGWKNSTDHWQDDAYWGFYDEYEGYWWKEPILEPPYFETSLDLAFVITGEEFPCCNKDWDYWTNPPNMWALPTGNVGIGTNNPGAKLDVRGSATFNDDGGDNDFRIEGTTEANLFFVDASTDRIGIGTNSPSSKLHIDDSGGHDSLRVYSDYGQLTMYESDKANKQWRFEVSNEDFYITEAAVATPFMIDAGAVHKALYLYKWRAIFNDMGNNYDFQVKSQNNDYMFYVDASTDRVGIGTNSPDEKFEVEWVSGGTDAEIGRGTSDTDITFIALRSPDGTKWYIYPNDSGTLVTTTTHP